MKQTNKLKASLYAMVKGSPAYANARRPSTQRVFLSQPAGPGGNALGWQAEGLGFHSPLPLTCLIKHRGLWTLSRDFCPAQ